MQGDMRGTALFQEVEAFYRCLRNPGGGQISDVLEISAAPDGRTALFTGAIINELEGAVPTRICSVDLETGDTRVLTFGPWSDRAPRHAPDGRRAAYLADRDRVGNFQLHLLDPDAGTSADAPEVEGWVEYFHWSPDSRRILLGVAGHGADVSGGQGAVSSRPADGGRDSWLPIVEGGQNPSRWRSLWIYDCESGTMRPLATPGLNIWEACWCGEDRVVAITSPGPEEGRWYKASLVAIDVDSGVQTLIYQPRDQLGWPKGAPNGERVAVVEAVCSDRWLVAGDLKLIDLTSGTVLKVDTQGVDISDLEWRSDRHLLVAGHRGFETVVGLYDAQADRFSEIWASSELTTGGRYATVSGFGDAGDCVIEIENFKTAPQIATLRGGQLATVRSFACDDLALEQAIGVVEPLTWTAPDGLTIEGWFVRPHAPGPDPTICYIHGGPVYHWRPAWPGRSAKFLQISLFAKHGFAVFLPNPRGSCGRGQDFARAVQGDMGGKDSADLLAGIDHLVTTGRADPDRLGVTGGSYGGYMTSWLVTQDRRFAAAAPVVPMTNLTTQHLLSNIPEFVDLFIHDRYDRQGSRYLSRSPLIHAAQVNTPVLNICGALDRCTPPQEAAQFHNALRLRGVESWLVVYPEEGHGVLKLPTAFDYVARLVAWFTRHMGTPHDDNGSGARSGG